MWPKRKESRAFTTAYFVSWSDIGKHIRFNAALTRHLLDNGWDRISVLFDPHRQQIAVIRDEVGTTKLSMMSGAQAFITCQGLLKQLRIAGYKKGRWLVTDVSPVGFEIDLVKDQIKFRLNHRRITDAAENIIDTVGY